MVEKIIAQTQDLVNKLEKLTFSEPISHTYNPLTYAWDSHLDYLKKYSTTKKKVLFMGMNPGPFGMAQTGVPFGEIAAVSDWMGINRLVNEPAKMHPKRPILGFGCPKSEVSGKRLWGLFAEYYPKANDFFTDHYVTNYCPLIWMAESGKNITPDKVKKEEIAPVEAACDAFLKALIDIQQPQFLIGVGAYAEKKIKNCIKGSPLEGTVTVGKILHPSPASPAANKGWAQQASAQLIEQKIWLNK